MLSNPLDRNRNDDLRLLRALLGRAHDLASRHALHSVVVGLAGFEGDPDYPEIVDYVVSALRVDDGVYRMTRERTLLLLTDVDAARAREIIERVLEDYRERFPSTADPALSVGYYEVAPGSDDVTVKQVLPTVFADPPRAH
jgi:hypothetical protein